MLLPCVQPAPDGAILIVRSPDINKILCRFILHGSPDNVSFTEHGIDFTRYDDMFRYSSLEYFETFVPVEAARMRLRYPVGMDGERLVYLKDYVSKRTADELKTMMYHSHVEVNFNEYPYYDDLSIKGIIELISYSAEQNKPKATEILIKTVYKKIDNNEISNSELREVIKDSARLGMTEMTALLMQKLYNRRGY